LKTLPKVILAYIFTILVWGSLASKTVSAITIAEQSQNWNTTLESWQIIQELGDNLNGVLDKFTFRVSNSKTRLEQFDYTAGNSRIYDKTTNTYISGCVSPTSDPQDRLRGLTFSTENTPSGFEDVTLDFSCHNYSFIPGHRYLVRISNANMPNLSVGRILFGTAIYGATTDDYFTGGGVRYAFSNQTCNASSYVWNSQSTNSRCNIFGSAKSDLYFILSNTDLPPKTAVIFIPGMGGSELKTSQDVFWSTDNGHGGQFSHSYPANEKVWINEDEATKIGDDDYFDVLRMKSDGVTSEANLALTGNLTSSAYADIDSFFSGLGYVKGEDFFVFAYDWRKDIRHTKDLLDSLIKTAKQKSGQPKVNIVAHSMGGLVSRYYIADSEKAKNVNKLIGLGVPHLGSVESKKLLMYGLPLGKPIFNIFNIGIAAFEVKDIAQNLTSNFQLLPSSEYYNFYRNSFDHPYPFRDDRDIDNNNLTGTLSFEQTKTLLSNLNHNMTAFEMGEQFHNELDPILNQTNGTKVYQIAGTAQPTLGQIHETWWIAWPVKLIPKTEEIFINGDDTVPLLSASLKNDFLDLTGGAKVYYTEQRHTDLVSSEGLAMQLVRSILEELDLPVEVRSEKIELEGKQISLDDGELELYDEAGRHTGLNDAEEIETNIPETFYSTSGKTRNAFVKKKAKKVKVKTTQKKKASSDPKTTNLKIRTYTKDKISKTAIYKDIPITEIARVEFELDPAVDTSPTLTLFPDSAKTDSISISTTSEISGEAAIDQTPPSTQVDLDGAKDVSNVYTSNVTVTLTGSDSESGILKIEYSLDNGLTVKTYTEPFTISSTGQTTLQIKSIDKLGNEEIPQEVVIEIVSSTPNSSPSSSNLPSSSGSNSTPDDSSSTSSTSSSIEVPPFITAEVNKTNSLQEVLGVSIQNPAPSAQLIKSDEEIIDPKSSIINQKDNHTLSLLLMTLGGIAIVFSVGLAFTFFKPTPK